LLLKFVAIIVNTGIKMFENNCSLKTASINLTIISLNV
jgi:hypothetical protein